MKFPYPSLFEYGLITEKSIILFMLPFKFSRDLLFIDKVRDIIEPYPNSPERALVLCVDEKSQIQALARTAPLLLMSRGQTERRAHDCKRHGPASPVRRI
jgi:hypothetical protein